MVRAVRRTDQWLDALWAPFWGTRNARTSSLPERRVARRGERWACRQGRRRGGRTAGPGRWGRRGDCRDGPSESVRSVRCGAPDEVTGILPWGAAVFGCPVYRAAAGSLRSMPVRGSAVSRTRSVRQDRPPAHRAIDATVAPAQRTRSAGASSTWTPRWPAETKMRGVRRGRARRPRPASGRRRPSGLMPPTTYPVARSAAAGSARLPCRPPAASARAFGSSSRSTGTTASDHPVVHRGRRASCTRAPASTPSAAAASSAVRRAARRDRGRDARAARTCGRDARCRRGAGCRWPGSRRSRLDRIDFGYAPSARRPHRARARRPAPSRSSWPPAAGPHAGALA